MFTPAIYIGAVTAANLSVATFGPAISPLNGFLLIGLDLSLRDKLHDRWQGAQLWPRMGVMIASAGAISYVLNPAAGKIALASMAAFVASGLVDAFAYQFLRNRPFMQRSNGSNAAGAMVDSLVFPTLAFGGFMPGIVAAQFAAKLAGGAMWAWFLNRKSPTQKESLS